MLNSASVAWTGFALCALTGCASLPVDMEPPRVTLTNLSIMDVTLFEQRYLVTLRVQNPNPRSIKVKGMDFELAINGVRFAQGVDDQGFEVSPFGESTIDVAVVSNTKRILELLTQLNRQTALRYALRGTAYLDGFGSKLPFNYEGSIEFAPPPATQPAKPIKTGRVPTMG